MSLRDVEAKLLVGTNELDRLWKHNRTMDNEVGLRFRQQYEAALRKYVALSGDKRG